MAELTGLASLPRISLEEVLLLAPATTRVDRKYLLPVARAEELLQRLPAGLRLLTIDDRLTTSYRSTYFDTPDLLTARAHVQGRRRRWKARSRLYVEDGLCRLELKLRDGHGVTRKVFHPSSRDGYGVLDDAGRAFLATQLQLHDLPLPSALEPAAEARYERATLADPATGTRLTVDLGVRVTRGRCTVAVDPGHVVLETKGGRAPAAADRLLQHLGARPLSFSKYAAAVSVIDPRLAGNDVHRLLGRELRLDETVPSAPSTRRTA